MGKKLTQIICKRTKHYLVESCCFDFRTATTLISNSKYLCLACEMSLVVETQTLMPGS